MADDGSFDSSPDVLTSAAQGRLRTVIERLERLEEDKAAVMADMKEVFAEAKGEGYDVKILRKVIRIRKQDKAKRQQPVGIAQQRLDPPAPAAQRYWPLQYQNPDGLNQNQIRS